MESFSQTLKVPAKITHADDVDKCCLSRVLEADEGKFHFLLNGHGSQESEAPRKEGSEGGPHLLEEQTPEPVQYPGDIRGHDSSVEKDGIPAQTTLNEVCESGLE